MRNLQKCSQFHAHIHIFVQSVDCFVTYSPSYLAACCMRDTSVMLSNKRKKEKKEEEKKKSCVVYYNEKLWENSM